VEKDPNKFTRSFSIFFSTFFFRGFHLQPQPSGKLDNGGTPAAVLEQSAAGRTL
jgi:hypothetical protein